MKHMFRFTVAQKGRDYLARRDVTVQMHFRAREARERESARAQGGAAMCSALQVMVRGPGGTLPPTFRRSRAATMNCSRDVPVGLEVAVSMSR